MGVNENVGALAAGNSPSEPIHPAYDAFATYATDPDRDLVRALEVFIEGFHLRPSLPVAMRRELELCLDGRDFIIPRRTRNSVQNVRAVRDIIEAYMQQSHGLLVLCGPQSRNHYWIDYEIRWWLANRPTAPIYFALTHGSSTAEEEIMPPALRDAGGGDLPIFFDLRGFYSQSHWRGLLIRRGTAASRRSAAKWQKVRPFAEEAAKIVARLLSDALNKDFSVNDIQTAFEEDERRKVRRHRIWSGIGLVGLIAVIGAGGRLASDASDAKSDAIIKAQLQRSRVLADEGGAALPAALAYAASAYAARPDGASVDAAFSAMQDLVPIERVLRPDGGEPAWVAKFLADDRFILVGGRSSVLRLVETATGDVKARIDLMASGIRHIVVGPGSKTIFVGTDRGLFRLALTLEGANPTLAVTGRTLEHERVGGLVIDGKRGRVIAGMLHTGAIWSFPLSDPGPWAGSKETTVMDPRFAEQGRSEVQSGIYGLAVANDDLVATGIDGVVSVLPAGNLKAEPRQFVHPHSIFAMDVSHTGAELAIADDEGGLSIYDIATATLRRAVKGSARSMSIARNLNGRLAQNDSDRLPNVGLAISPDDEIIAVTSHDRSVRFLTFETLAPIGLAVHRAAPRAVAFGRGGQALTVGDDGALQLVRPVAQPEVARVADVASFVALSDGRIVAWPPAAHGKAGLSRGPIRPQQRSLTLVDPSAGTLSPRGTAEGDISNIVVLDGAEFAFRSAASSLIQTAASTGKARCPLLKERNEPGEVDLVQDMMAGPDPATLTSLTKRTGSGASAAHVWDLTHCVIRQAWPTTGAAAVAAGAVATIEDGTRLQVRTSPYSEPATLSFAHPVTSVAIANGGKSVLAVLGDQKAVCFCHPGLSTHGAGACSAISRSYECRAVSAQVAGPNAPEIPSAIRLSASGNAAIAQYRPAIQLLGTAASGWKFQQVAQAQLRQVTPPFAFDTTDRFLAVPAGETGVRLVEVETGRTMAEFPTNGRVMQIAFTAGSVQYLATRDGTMLRVWDWRPQSIRARICDRWNPEIDVSDDSGSTKALTRMQFCKQK